MTSTKNLTGCLLVIACAAGPDVVHAQTVNIQTEFHGRIDKIEPQGKELFSGAEVVQLKSPMMEVVIDERKHEIGFQKHVLEGLQKMLPRIKKFDNKADEILIKEKNWSNYFTNETLKARHKELTKHSYARSKIITNIYKRRIKEKEAKMAFLEKSVERLNRRLSSSFKCPFTKCRVERVLVKRGQWVTAGTILMTVSRRY